MTAIVLILFAAIVIVLLWVLFVPVCLVINTSQERYEIFQVGIFSISLKLREKPVFHLRILGVPVSMKPRVKSARESLSPVKKKNPVVYRSPYSWLYLMDGLIRSFRLKKLNCSADTDDVVLNAQLYPVAVLMSHDPVLITLNFKGQNYLNLEVELKVYRVCWTLIRFLTKK